VNLLDDGIVDTFGLVSATSGVDASIFSGASDSVPSYSQHYDWKCI